MDGEYELIKQISYLCVNSISTVFLLYITICQIVIFIRKRLYRKRLRSVKEVLKPSNIPLVMNAILIISGIFGISLSACLSAVNVSKVIYWKCFVKFKKEYMENETEISVIKKCFVNYGDHMTKLFSAGQFFYMFLITFIYMLLWLRQTMFNTEPTLKRLSSKYLNIFSYFQGCFIILSGVILGISWMYYLRYADPFTFIFLSIQLEIQISVLILFLVPLIKHQRSLKFLYQNPNPPDRLIRLMKRSTAATIVAMVTDIATIVVFQIASEYLMSINALLNMCCVIFCFADWREKFIPCLVLCTNDKAEAEQVDAK
uniref:uncharacterized protein LOC120327868 n=1 Tax=Styela clava TaxID=7725 RepID=UPI00193A208A|nr:uncharacterized protein LOC120327868 [Styela clava]